MRTPGHTASVVKWPSTPCDVVISIATARASARCPASAHWYQDLPLADEIDIIAGAWRDYAILVDDFKVPGDDGYAYDDYGPGKCLDMDYLKPVLARNQLRAFFPTTRSKDESGGRPGYVVVVPDSAVAGARSASLLREVANA